MVALNVPAISSGDLLPYEYTFDLSLLSLGRGFSLLNVSRLIMLGSLIIIIIIMATYSAPKFNKTVAPGASTHHCKTKLEQKANDREL